MPSTGGFGSVPVERVIRNLHTPPQAGVRSRYRRRHRTPQLLNDLVLEFLMASNRPVTAHEIARLSEERGAGLSPAQVYRVLDRLMAAGSVQRIEVLAAYVPIRGERMGFLVCLRCRAIEMFSISDLASALDNSCKAAGFCTPAIPVRGAWSLR